MEPQKVSSLDGKEALTHPGPVIRALNSNLTGSEK